MGIIRELVFRWLRHIAYKNTDGVLLDYRLFSSTLCSRRARDASTTSDVITGPEVQADDEAVLPSFVDVFAILGFSCVFVFALPSAGWMENPYL